MPNIAISEIHTSLHCFSEPDEFEEDEDGVRAPIPQKQEVLIQPGFEDYALNRNAARVRGSRVRSVFDGFRNFSQEASELFYIVI